ncbi:MAG: hypothetical protein HY890_05100 [Deltaproteobacteria bacterium]|nr:hypothetical protein [Deltaproteobacteria bacterium]
MCFNALNMHPNLKVVSLHPAGLAGERVEGSMPPDSEDRAREMRFSSAVEDGWLAVEDGAKGV